MIEARSNFTPVALKLIEVGGKYLERAMATKTDMQIEVAPGITTGKDYSYFLVELAEALHELQQLYSVGPDRLSRYNFDDVLQLAGYTMSPMGSPAPLHRTTEIPKEAWEMYKYIVEDYTEEFQHGLSLSIPRISSSGPPYYSHNLEYKASIVKDWIENVKEICFIYRKDGYLGLLNRENPIAPFFGTNHRIQTDKITAKYNKQGKLMSAVSKLREVEDWLGKHVTALKELPAGFSRLVSRVRSRLVWAMSGTINYVMGALMQGYRYCALNKTMKEVLHHIDVRQTILSLKSCKRVGAWDITRFDHSIRARAQQIWIQVLRSKGLREEICDMIEDIVYGPAIFPCDYPGGSGVNVTSYPLGETNRARDLSYDFGLPSGIWWVADVGKTQGMWIVMWSMYKEGVIKNFRDRAERQKFYDNRFSWYLVYKGSGDDTIAGENTEGAIQKVCDHAAEIGFDIKEDPEVSFLGWTLIQGDGVYEIRPNLASGVTKFWVPERRIARSIHDNTPRKYWAYGIPLRNEYYGTHPLWDEVWNRSLDVATKHFRVDIRKRIEKARIEQEREVNKMIDMDNVYDRLFIQNSEYVHYRFDPSFVSPDLLKTQYLVIPPEETEKLVSALGINHVSLR